MAKKSTAKKLDSKIAKMEAGKSQAKIGDIRQLRVKFEETCASEIVSKALVNSDAHPDLSLSETLMGVHERIEQRAYKALARARKEIGAKKK